MCCISDTFVWPPTWKELSLVLLLIVKFLRLLAFCVKMYEQRIVVVCRNSFSFANARLPLMSLVLTVANDEPNASSVSLYKTLITASALVKFCTVGQLVCGSSAIQSLLHILQRFFQRRRKISTTIQPIQSFNEITTDLSWLNASKLSARAQSMPSRFLISFYT